MRIELTSVSFTYTSPVTGHCEALKDVSFTIHPGERIAVVGVSGSGKSTLMQHLNGLLAPNAGSVQWHEKDKVYTQEDLTDVRRKVGMVFQFPEVGFFEETVYNEIGFGPKNCGIAGADLEKCIHDALEQVNLDKEFSGRVPFLLSGGEKRRVAIASVLAMNPEVLVLDEPTVGLDPATSQRIEKIMINYNQSGRTLVFVSHDMDLVARLASQIIVLKDGRIVFSGKPRNLFMDLPLLKSVGLELPVLCRDMHVLKENHNLNVNPWMFTLDEARDEIFRVVRSMK